MDDITDSRMRANLLNLPLELQWKIFELLDYPSALYLTATCHSIKYSPKNPLSFQAPNDKRAFLFEAEGFPQHSQGYACFKCGVVKPRDQFSVRQVTKKRGKGNVQSFSRFCIDCGLSKGIYSRGQQVQKTDHSVYWKCSSCITLKDSFCYTCAKCSDCLGLTHGFGEGGCPLCGLFYHSESNRLAEYLS